MKNAVLIVLTVIFMTGCSEQIELPVSDVVKLHRAAESGNLDLVKQLVEAGVDKNCLLYTSPSPRDRQKSRMPSSA